MQKLKNDVDELLQSSAADKMIHTDLPRHARGGQGRGYNITTLLNKFFFNEIQLSGNTKIITFGETKQ